ncbi:hypothetical protein ACMZ7J_02890 [Gardnerella greenwoodii]|uniref:hypothetical protein n=1 Tax=Gardnerella greenwoodii TaxID=2914925 RepID=UPI0039F05F24
MADNKNSVSFDGAIASKLSEMLAQANARIAALSVMIDVKDAQLKDLKAELDKKEAEHE